MGEISFVPQVPRSDEVLRANVRSCLARGLPELRDFEYPFTETLRLIANGPSAKSAPLTAGPTAAINGSLKLFTDRGLAPTYWVACDPQELVADFLDVAPPQTHYLLASKCHPSVFDRLLSRGRQVTVWHVDEPGTADLIQDRRSITSEYSVTLCCFQLFVEQGWRAFETWGWDGCAMGGVNHASGNIDLRADIIDVDVGNRSFLSTGSWSMEAQNASSLLGDFPWPLAICGGGMIAEIMGHVWAEKVNEVLAKAAA